MKLIVIDVQKGITDEDAIRVIKVAEEIKEYMQKYAKMGL